MRSWTAGAASFSFRSEKPWGGGGGSPNKRLSVKKPTTCASCKTRDERTNSAAIFNVSVRNLRKFYYLSILSVVFKSLMLI